MWRAGDLPAQPWQMTWGVRPKMITLGNMEHSSCWVRSGMQQTTSTCQRNRCMSRNLRRSGCVLGFDDPGLGYSDCCSGALPCHLSFSSQNLQFLFQWFVFHFGKSRDGEGGDCAPGAEGGSPCGAIGGEDCEGLPIPCEVQKCPEEIINCKLAQIFISCECFPLQN